MELGYMFKVLINSIQALMISFRFTIGGVTIDLWQWFCWLILARFLIGFIKAMHGGD